MARRDLLVLHDAGGTVPPMLAIAQALVERDHEVTVLGQPCVQARATAAGCRFVAFDSVGDYRRDEPLEEQLEAVGTLMTGAEPAREVAAAIETWAPDRVVVDCNLAGPLAAVEAAGVPSAVLLHSMYVTYVDSWFGPLWPFLAPAINETRARHGLDACGSWTDVFERHARMYAAVPEVFDAPTATRPPSLRHVGFLVPEAEAAAPRPARRERPAVLVSLGTTDQQQGPLLRTILAAVATMDVDAVVTTAGQGVPTDVPSNVTVHEFLPHHLVLPSVDAVVAHGGLGTVAAALSAGVPLVCTPIARDQPVNAERVVALGAGLSIDAPTGTPEAVAAALHAVLTDPRYRHAAARVRDASVAAGGARAVADDLEALK